MYSTLSNLIYGSGVDPYAKFRSSDGIHSSAFVMTNLEKSIIRDCLERTGTDFWLEIGSMFGGSAIRTSQTAQEMGRDLTVLCVDPFCGDVSMWEVNVFLQERKKAGILDETAIYLDLEGARPTLYDKFMSNVMGARLDSSILPLSVTSMVGMRLLERLREDGHLDRGPGVIYLDTAHEWYETYIELVTAWRILAPGGVLIGDDYNWPSVNHDVQRFAREHGVEIEMKERAHWLIQKPLSVGYLPSPFFTHGYEDASTKWKKEDWQYDKALDLDRILRT
jgi:predicted O-methyltransferase YrrM